MRARRVGITGGIGSGKTTVAHIFEVLGIPVYYADDRAKELMERDHALRSQIIDAFGELSYTTSGLNRPYLAKKIFGNAKQVARINAIVHPVVRGDFEDWVDLQQTRFVLQEAALLVDNGGYKNLDGLITVTASVEIRTARIRKRDAIRTLEQIQQIIASQVDEAERLAVADHVIENEGTDLMIPQVIKVYDHLMA